MIAPLTPEQRQAVQDNHRQPTLVIDPETNEQYWLLTKDRFEEVRRIFESDPVSSCEQRMLLRAMGNRAGWDDPEMDAYDDYDAQRRTAS